MDDPPVRGLRHAGEAERALPLPARTGPARPLDRVRPAHADGTRLRRRARRSARSARSASRSTRSTTWRRSSTASRWTSVSTSMTINAPAPILVAMYVVAAEQAGRSPRARSRGTAQNDVLKEYVARGTYIYPPRPSVRLAADLIAWCANEAPRFNAISLSGYHIREAGSTAVQEIAFAFANAIAYIEAVHRATASHVDDVRAASVVDLQHAHNFFEEIAKYRALRRMWARIMRERFGATDPRSMMLRTHTQTGGSTLTAAAAREQHRARRAAGARGDARRRAVAGALLLRRGARDPDRAAPRRSPCAPSRSSPRRSASPTRSTRSAARSTSSALTDELERRAARELLEEVERARRRGRGDRDRLLPARDRRGGLPRGDGAGVGRARRRRRQPPPRGRTTPRRRSSRSTRRSPRARSRGSQDVRAARDGAAVDGGARCAARRLRARRGQRAAGDHRRGARPGDAGGDLRRHAPGVRGVQAGLGPRPRRPARSARAPRAPGRARPRRGAGSRRSAGARRPPRSPRRPPASRRPARR